MDEARKHSKRAHRRDELLDRAWGMLVAEGFAAVTLNRFLEASGISKGAFYHYYDSWESLLEALIDKVAGQAVRRLTTADGEPPRPPLERLNEFLGVSAARPAGTTQVRAMLRQVHRSGDLALLARLREKTDELSLPTLERIIEDGIATGDFETPYPAETAEAVLDEWNRTLLRVFELLDGPGNAAQVRRAILRRGEAAAHITERLLGLDRGNVARANAADVDRIVSASRTAPGSSRR